MTQDQIRQLFKNFAAGELSNRYSPEDKLELGEKSFRQCIIEIDRIGYSCDWNYEEMTKLPEDELKKLYDIIDYKKFMRNNQYRGKTYKMSLEQFKEMKKGLTT
jgi:hypothetical protein